MGIYQYTDPTTGQTYSFEHAGDAPTDEDFAFISDYVDQQRASYAERYQKAFGREFEPQEDQGTFSRGISRGIQDIKGAVGEAIGTLGEETSLDFLRDFGLDWEEEARQRQGELNIGAPDQLRAEDVEDLSSFGTYAGQTISRQLPQLGLGLAAAAATPIIAGASGLTAAGIGIGAAALTTAPILFGNDIQRQEDEVAAGRKDSVDVGAALTATFGQSALEGISSKLLLGGLLKPLGSGMAGWKGIFTRTTSRAGGGATSEGLTEVGQQLLERAQAGLPIDSDEAIAEYREAAIAGGLIGGSTRATLGAFDSDTQKPDDVETTGDEATAAQAVTDGTEVAATEAALTPEASGVEVAQDIEAVPDTTQLAMAQADAQAVEERNAADSAAPKGAAEQTTQERAEAEAAVQQTMREQNAKAKTDEYLKKATPSAQQPKGADIQAKPENPFARKDVDAEATVLKKQQDQTTAPITPTKTPSKVTKEMLDDLGVFSRAPMRKTIEGKDLTDPEVQKKLRDYAKNTIIKNKVPELESRIDELLGGLDGTRAGSQPTGTGASAQGSEPSVDGSRGGRSAVEDTREPATPDAGPVGDGVLATDGADATAGVQRDTLAEEIEPEKIEQLSQDVEQATATPVQLPNLKLPLVPQPSVKGTLAPTGQFIPAPVEPEARAEQVQAAPVPQEELQAAEQARNLAAQSALNELYQKQPVAVQRYHDLSVAGEQDGVDTTTALDKEAVVELLSMKKKDLDDNQKAARLYFERFRRPKDALAEIGALIVVGPKKTFTKDYTMEQLPFYKGMTQGSARRANKWVFSNMSPQANQILRTARVQAKRDTTEFVPSDKVILAKKFAKKTLDSERDAYNKQLSREAKELTEVSRAAAVAKRLKLDSSMEGLGAISGMAISRGGTKTALDTVVRSEATGRELFRVTTPIKGETAFDAYLLSMGFKKRKLPKQDDYLWFDPEDNNRHLTDEELMDFYDGWAASREYGFLLEEADDLLGLNQGLLPSIKTALQRGELKTALQGVAATNMFERVQQVAGKLSLVVGDTKIQVVDNLSRTVGRTAAGMFDPSNNTIYIDANNGMNVHTLLHEMTHAATHATLANKSLPEVKQLEAILAAAKEQLSNVYGTQNIDEFVAEAFSNPTFQILLSGLRVDGTPKTGWEIFTDAVKRIVRKIWGLAPTAPQNAADQVDLLIEGMLSPSPATRAAPNLFLEAKTPAGSMKLLKQLANIAPDSVQDKADIIYSNTVAPSAKAVVLNSLPSNILAEVASKKIPFANDLHMLIKKMSGETHARSDVLDAMRGDVVSWQRKNVKHAKTLNNIIPRSTYLQIDPSRTDPQYMKTINESKEKQQEYKELRKQYLSMDKKGQEYYRQIRNFFKNTYDDILAALDARLEATIPDQQVRKAAFARLRELLQKDSGVITPYFPLQRKGDFRLAYTAADPNTGVDDRFVEYYPTLRKAQQARDMLAKYGGRDVEITLASKTMNFERAPSTSFVRNILETVQLKRENFNSEEDYRQTMQSIVDLALDAMPERSFMQNFRRRKGVRGFIGDTTPTGIGGQVFDTATMLKEKGRDMNRQLIQMKSAAKIEQFRRDLEQSGAMQNPDTAQLARTLDKMAQFAARPNIPSWSQTANSIGFAATMGANISSAAITFFDVAMSAMPVLAGKHGIANTTRAYGTATRALAGAPTKRTILMEGPDGQPIEREVDMGVAGKSIANYTPEQLIKKFGNGMRMDILVEMGLDQAQFNQSMTREQLEVGSAPGSTMEFVNKISSFFFHHSERYNRETTLTAAYMMKVKDLQKSKKQLTEDDYRNAAQEAISDTEYTLGSTASAGRPVWAQSGVGNILFLFKRFAVSKYYMMTKMAQEAFAGDPVAKKQLAYFLTTTGLMSGLGGMPMMGLFGMLYDMFADEDEDDFESVTRKLVGEGIYGGLANEILGVDVANRISMNSLLYRAPIVEKDQSPLWTLAEQLGGPIIGITNSALRGAPEAMEGVQTGDWDMFQRGMESMLPASLRNISKGARFYIEGATTRRGDVITEDINPYNSFMQGIGFAPQGYIQALEFNKNNRRRQEAINSKRTKLLRRRNMATREGDIDEVRKVDALIREFNAGLPKGAEKSYISSDTIQRSYTSFGKTTGKMRGGMTYTPFMEKSLKEFDQGFQLF